MDLTPLSELRERLRDCAVAGTALLPENFRLRRAVEGFAPLASAAPVFGKIHALSNALLTAGEEERPGALLDALSLTDAVLCTQGAVTVSGTVEPLTGANWGSAVTNAPYSLVAPLCDALANSGGGRYNTVIEAREQHRELFQDYRIKAALVGALGAAYTDLANQALDWLIEDGEASLPLLMQEFDPQGKRGMVRRVQAIDAIAGAKANSFYLENLETAGKEVRAALIYALRHDESNANRLLELAKTERGDCKKQAHWALAHLHTAPVAEFWRKLFEKKPEQAAEFMVLSPSEEASELVGAALLEVIAPYERDPAAPFPAKTAGRLRALMDALPGKASPSACAFYRRAAALGDALDRPVDSEKEPFQLDTAEPNVYAGGTLFSQSLPILLRRSMALHPNQALFDLAETLSDEAGEEFLSPLLAARLLRAGAEQVYEFARPYFEKKGLFHQVSRCHKASYNPLLETLNMIEWDTDSGQQVLCTFFRNPVTGRNIRAAQPLREPLDLRWYELLTDPKLSRKGDSNADQLLIHLIQPDNPAVCRLVGEYLYHRALSSAEPQGFFAALRLCGWERCENLVVRYCQKWKNAELSAWNLYYFLRDLPGSGEARAQETERILTLAREGKVKLLGDCQEKLQEWIVNMRNGHPIEP